MNAKFRLENTECYALLLSLIALLCEQLNAESGDEKHLYTGLRPGNNVITIKRSESAVTSIVVNHAPRLYSRPLT